MVLKNECIRCGWRFTHVKYHTLSYCVRPTVNFANKSTAASWGNSDIIDRIVVFDCLFSGVLKSGFDLDLVRRFFAVVGFVKTFHVVQIYLSHLWFVF